MLRFLILITSFFLAQTAKSATFNIGNSENINLSNGSIATNDIINFSGSGTLLVDSSKTIDSITL